MTETSNADEEYIEILTDAVIVHAKKFSLYAVGSRPKHQHQGEMTGYEWTQDGCTAAKQCETCKQPFREAVRLAISGKTLSMSHVPNGLRLLIAGYTDGKLESAQVIETPQTENPITVEGKELQVFFLNETWVPLRSPLKEMR